MDLKTEKTKQKKKTEKYPESGMKFHIQSQRYLKIHQTIILTHHQVVRFIIWLQKQR